MKKCPNCGRESNTEFCGGCGYDLRGVPSLGYDIDVDVDQGKEIAGSNTDVVKGKSKKRRIVFAIIGAILIAGLIGYMKLDREIKYSNTLYNYAQTVMETSAETEEACNLIVQVWGDAIYGETDNEETSKYVKGAADFDEALANLYADEDFINKLTGIQEGLNKVDGYKSDLKNPPKKYESLYEDAIDIYAEFSVFTNMALNSSGSFNSYTEKFQKVDDELVEHMEKFVAKLPEW